ncbi:hypothetical protein B296_00040101, partial [Ensete ventricosum]
GRTADLTQVSSAPPTYKRTPHCKDNKHDGGYDGMVSHKCSKRAKTTTTTVNIGDRETYSNGTVANTEHSLPISLPPFVLRLSLAFPYSLSSFPSDFLLASGGRKRALAMAECCRICGWSQSIPVAFRRLVRPDMTCSYDTSSVMVFMGDLVQRSCLHTGHDDKIF